VEGFKEESYHDVPHFNVQVTVIIEGGGVSVVPGYYVVPDAFSHLIDSNPVRFEESFMLQLIIQPWNKPLIYKLF